MPSTPPARTTQEVGRLLRARREELGLTQEEVALGVGVNRMSVSTIERGLPGVRLGIVLDLANALGLDLRFVPRGGEDA